MSQKRIKKLLKDKKRLDWLEQHRVWIDPQFGEGGIVAKYRGGSSYSTSVRQVIDKAIREMQ